MLKILALCLVGLVLVFGECEMEGVENELQTFLDGMYDQIAASDQSNQSVLSEFAKEMFHQNAVMHLADNMVKRGPMDILMYWLNNYRVANTVYNSTGMKFHVEEGFLVNKNTIYATVTGGYLCGNKNIPGPGKYIKPGRAGILLRRANDLNSKWQIYRQVTQLTECRQLGGPCSGPCQNSNERLVPVKEGPTIIKKLAKKIIRKFP